MLCLNAITFLSDSSFPLSLGRMRTTNTVLNCKSRGSKSCYLLGFLSGPEANITFSKESLFSRSYEKLCVFRLLAEVLSSGWRWSQAGEMQALHSGAPPVGGVFCPPPPFLSTCLALPPWARGGCLPDPTKRLADVPSSAFVLFLPWGAGLRGQRWGVSPLPPTLQSPMVLAWIACSCD